MKLSFVLQLVDALKLIQVLFCSACEQFRVSYLDDPMESAFNIAMCWNVHAPIFFQIFL